MRRSALCVVFALAILLPARAAEIVYLGVKSAPFHSLDAVNHSPWTALLSKYVDANGMVDYRRWRDSPDDVRMLEDYLVQLSSGDPKLPASDSSRLAFWINAYNAVTIRGILREYPTTSIRNHTARLWGYNIWKHLQLYVGGQPYSLDQIEHEVLRKMNEPRIHFAIVCASKGCPRLRDEAYLAEKIDSQLEANAKDFFSRRQNFYHDVDQQRFLMSSILKWFGEDFGPNQRELLATISPWLPDSAQPAAKAGTVDVEFLDYDWSLNER